MIRFLPYFIFLICVQKLCSQEKANFVFDHLSPATGFPSNTARSIVKNTDGSLWMLTEKGLMRYNGHSGKFYAPTKDSTGLLQHPLFKLYADRHGILWISYLEACISSFDPVTEKFTHYYHNPKDNSSFLNGGANQFMEDSKGNLWIAVWGGGLAKLNQSTGKFINYTPHEGDSTSINTDNITSVCELKSGKFLVGAWESGKFGPHAFLQYFDPQTEKFKRFNLQDFTASSAEEKERLKYVLKIIHFIYEEDEDNVWVGSFVGLVHINLKNKTIERVTGTPDEKEKYESQRGYENATDYVRDGDNLWVATEVTGIMVVNLKTKMCSYLKYEFSNSSTLSSDNITSLYRDDDGNIWVSTRGAAAADIYSPVLQQFRFITNEKLKAEKGNRQQGATSLNYILTSKTSPYVFLPHGNGLSIYDPKKESLISYDSKQLKRMCAPADLKHLPGDRINMVSVKETKKHILLLANGRVLKLSADLKKLSLPIGSTYANNLATNPYTDDVAVLTFNKETGFFAGAKNKSVFLKLNKNTLKIEEEIPLNFPAFKDHEYVEATLMAALDEDMWFIALNRIQFGVLSVKTKKLTCYSPRAPLSNLPDSVFGYLTVDAEKKVWLKATNGLYCFDYRTGKMDRMNEKLGIKNEPVSSVTTDLNGEVWVALKQDLVRYTHKTGETFRLSNRLGLKVGAFSPVVTGINFSDTIYIPTNYGLLHFDPQKLVFEKKMNTLFLSSVIINKDTLNEHELTDFIRHKPNLAWDQNFISFEFASHQYYTPGPKKYEYRLLGLDTTWYNNSNRNYVSYTNLSAGSYTLEVLCTNVFENRSKKLSVSFFIDKPFWKKWWFIVLEIAGALLMIWLYVKFREQKLNKQKERLEKTVKERTQEVVEKAREIELQNEIIQEKNKEMTDSIRYAQRIQKTLLAHEDFIKQHLPEHFVLFKPKDIVSGDFYWAAAVETTPSNGGDTLFFLAVCDCTGHGVPGAFMSLMNISFLNEAISEKGIHRPDLVFNYVRERIISSLSADGSKDGMDGTLLCYNKNNNSICYASAYNRPLHITNNGFSELPADKMPIGTGEKSDSFNLYSIQQKKGDIVYLYTDGFADQFGGPKGKKFKYKALNELLRGISDREPEDQKGILEITFENWRGDLEQIDDVMVVGLKW